MKFHVILLCTLVSAALKNAACSTQSETVECGVRVTDKSFQNISADSNWPWLSSVFLANDTPTRKCSSTLIYKHFLLTTESCLMNEKAQVMDPMEFMVEINGSMYAVYRIHTVEDSSSDIALIELQTEVPFGDEVRPGCLPQQDTFIGETGRVAGHGSVSVIGMSACAANGSQICNAMFVAGGFCDEDRTGRTICSTDTGAGLMFWRNGRWQIGGIATLKSKNDQVITNVTYTNVYQHKEWIMGILSKRAEPVGNNLPRDCGRRTSKSDFPWIIGVYEELWPNVWVYRNLGTLIGRRYAISTFANTTMVAMMSQNPVVPRMRVLLGATKLSDWLIDANFTNLSYRDVDEQKSELLVNIQSKLLRLDREVIFDDWIQPICLPLNANLYTPMPGPVIFRGSHGGFTSAEISRTKHPFCYSGAWNDKGLCLHTIRYCYGDSEDHRVSIIVFKVEQGERYTQYGSIGNGFYLYENPLDGFQSFYKFVVELLEEEEI